MTKFILAWAVMFVVLWSVVALLVSLVSAQLIDPLVLFRSWFAESTTSLDRFTTLIYVFLIASYSVGFVLLIARKLSKE